MKTITLIIVLLALAALAMGLYGATGLGETTALVRWSERESHHKSGEPFSNIRAELATGEIVQFTSAHTPPPNQGDRIILRIRRNFFGAPTYSWKPDAAHAE